MKYSFPTPIYPEIIHEVILKIFRNVYMTTLFRELMLMPASLGVVEAKMVLVNNFWTKLLRK